MKTKPYQTCSFLTTFLTSPIRVALALAATFALTQLAGAASYTWTNTVGNWSAPANWNPNAPAGGPLATDSAIFGNAGASSSPTTVNNTVDLSFAGTIANLTNGSVASQAAGYVYDVTQIPSGQTLTVSTNVFVGGVNEGTGTYATYAYMVGAGTFKVTGSSLIVQNYGSASGANNCAYLNLSGLTNFVYNNTNGTIGMASFVPANYASGSQGTRQGGSMILAAGSNNITAAAINLGQSAVAQAGPSGSLASGIASQLTLGPGTNIINVANFNIAAQKNPFTVSNSGGGLRIRGVSGADSDSSVNITIGNRNVGGGTGATAGNLLLNGCAVDIKAGTLTVGENTGGAPSTAADAGNGVLQFDTGTVSANRVLMAYNTSANNGANQAQCNGTLQVGANGTLLIGAGQLFALATAAASGPSTGTLIISNGLVNCQGPIVMGTNAGTLSGSIVLQGGGTLNMGPGSYIGTLGSPVTTLTLDVNSTLSISVPSVSYTNICVGTLNWPATDTNVKLAIAAIPTGITNGSTFPFLNFTTMNGTLNSPAMILPVGGAGNLSLVGNTMYINITRTPLPGVNQLLNPDFGLLPLGANWTAVGGTAILSTNNNYPNTGNCTSDTQPVQVLAGTTNTAILTGSFVAGGSTNSWSQSVAVAAGSTLTAGAFTYIAHEDIMSGSDSFYYELDFFHTNGTLLAAYESTIVTNMTCAGPNIIPLDTWVLMPTTNQMQVTGGINTGAVMGTVASSVMAPPQTATAKFKAVFIQRNATDTGSAYVGAASVGWLAGPVPPTIVGANPNLVTLCTNTAYTCTATSSVVAISSIQVIVQSTTLGGLTTNTVTNPAGLTVTGLGTQSANVSYPLAMNTIYQSVVVTVTDANGVTVSSTNVFDTLVPTLVIEASDFNYTISGNSGLFMDTPPNGGLALYTNQVGTQGIDENKVGRAVGSVAGEIQSYYRTNDAVLIGAAAPNAGNPPTGTEQKFVTAAANGDTTDFEVEVGYNSPGDWLNYTRTFGSGGSAPAGTYNVWCYLAVSGSGVQSTFSQVTSDPTQGNQTTNFLGYFGSASFTNGSYNTFLYVPLVDQFGNRVTITLTNGQYTFKSTVVGNPNLGFYLFMPVAPVYTPVPLHIYPDGTQPFESTGQFTFTVGPAQGASISTNGIGLILNGVDITSGLSFSQAGGGAWTVNYSLQSNAVYTAVINVTNTAGLTFTYPVSFDTFSQNNFMIEAVDFDFNGGQFIDNPIPTGAYVNGAYPIYAISAVNSYFFYPEANSDNEAITNVDLTTVNTDAGETFLYRPAESCGTQVATDFLRGKFYVTNGSTVTAFSDFNVGWWNPGTWLNYTRTFPTNTYNIYGRLASGASYSGATMSLVTSGQGTTNQTTQLLGSFADPNANGWQTWDWVPLLDTNGQMVVVPLGGVETLKVTAPPGGATGSLNANFYMLVPAVVAPQAVHLSVSRTGSTISIQFPTKNEVNYTVLYSGSLNPANWQTLTTISGDGTVQTATDTMGSSPRFYRVLAQ